MHVGQAVPFITQKRVAKRAFWNLFVLMMVGLTLLPIINTTLLISTTGANNLGNDDLGIINPLNQFLSGNYDWNLFFKHSFLAGSHSMAIPVLIIYLTAQIASLDVYVLSYISIIFAVFRLMLQYDLLGHGIKNRLKIVILPALSFLTFANSQISVFAFGQAGLQVMISFFGALLAIWGVFRFPGRWTGVVLGVIGAMISAWSGGYGVIAWPILLLSMVLLRFRNPRQYVFWFVGAVVTALPYISFRLLVPNFVGHGIAVDFFRYDYLFQMIGLPFESISNLDAIRSVGIVGASFMLSGLALTWLRRRGHSAYDVLPPLILILYSLLAIYQVTIFRDSPAPWYTSISLLFWSGIIGLASVFVLATRWDGRNPVSPLSIFWGIGVVIGVGYLFLSSNIDYLDKGMYLWMRRPVSASCALYYRTAPTYCEQYIFQWGVGNPENVADLAQPLERHQLATFAPHQTWTLQSDFGLNNVRIREFAGIPDIVWSLDGGTKLIPTTWSDFRHLNLFLHTPNAISWTVDLPPNVVQADFHSAVAISETAADEAGTDGVTFVVSIGVDGEPPQTAFTQTVEPDEHTWQPFSLPLAAYHGHRVTIHLSSTMASNVSYDWAMYRYPYIDVVFDVHQGATNTELNQEEMNPPFTQEDIQFDLSSWERSDIGAGSSPNAWRLEAPHGYLSSSLNHCFSHYSALYLRVAAPETLARQRFMWIVYSYVVEGGAPEMRHGEFIIPLYRDSEAHEYYYPARLLELDDPAILVGLRLTPFLDSNTEFTIEDFRLIRGDEPSRCQTQN